MAQARLSWIDFAKVASICLVTSYHTQPPLTGYAALFIQILRLPAFFMIAGFLFNDKKFTSLLSFLRHRAKQLLIPYVCFEALVIAFLCSNWEERQDAIINALLGHPTKCIPLWFLVCLFGMQTVHYLCIQAVQRISGHDWECHAHLLLGIYILFSIALSSFDITHNGQLNAIIINLPFYAAANCCKDIIINISWKQPLRISCSLLIGMILIYIKCNYLHESMGWADGTLFYMVHLAAGFLLLPAYIATCKLIGQAIGHLRIIEYLGGNTVIILALHSYFILLIARFVEEDSLATFSWLNPCLTVCIVVAHLPIIWFIKKYIPWIIGRKLHKRHRANGI